MTCNIHGVQTRIKLLALVSVLHSLHAAGFCQPSNASAAAVNVPLDMCCAINHEPTGAVTLGFKDSCNGAMLPCDTDHRQCMYAHTLMQICARMHLHVRVLANGSVHMCIY